MITTTIEKITPEMAKAYLATSEGNPRYSGKKLTADVRVKTYARAMRNGNWELTGEGIAFDKNGHLIDGHNRLTAVVLSEVPVDFLVVRGVETIAKRYIDSGQARSINQRLRSGYDFSEMLSSRLIIATYKVWLRQHGNKNRSLTDTDAASNWISMHKDALETAYKISCTKKNGQVSNNGTYCYSVFEALEAGVNPAILTEFTDIANTGFYEGNHQLAAVVTRKMLQEIPPQFQMMEDRRIAIIETGIYKFINGETNTKSFIRPKKIYTMLNAEAEL